MPTRLGFIGGVSAAAAAAAQAIAAAPTASVAAAPIGTPLVPIDTLLKEMLDGNRRFVAADLPSGPADKLQERREMLVEQQAPFAAVLTCADSRLIPNLVFLRGVGDLFVLRVAGNFATDEILGSMEYAIEHLHTRLIMVLGHERCGAVKAVYDAIANRMQLPKHLDSIEHGIRPAIEAVVAQRGSLEEAIRANVTATVSRIEAAQPVINPAVDDGTVRVVGAKYHLFTGHVEVLSGPA